MDLARRARQLLRDGYDAGDVIRAFMVEREARDAEVNALFRGGERAGRTAAVRHRALFVAGLTVVSAFALGRLRPSLVGSELLALRIGLAVLVLIAVVSLLIALNSTERAERRSGAAAGRMWRSGFTIYFFRAAGYGLRPEDRAAPSRAEIARINVPDPIRKRIPELPALLDRVDDVLATLREREQNLELALAESGPRDLAPAAAVTDGAPGVTTRAILLHRRVTLVGELRTALDDLQGQRGDVIAAQENVRLQLARARAGLTPPESLAPDVASLKAVLDAAHAD
jgi:hypothetical protein